jgi:hypothetical protein
MFWAEIGAKWPNYGQNRAVQSHRPCMVQTVLYKHTVLAPSCTVQYGTDSLDGQNCSSTASFLTHSLTLSLTQTNTNTHTHTTQ